jgi:hypothetical protein
MNDRMWTATVIRLLALITRLLDVISLVTSGAASRELYGRAFILVMSANRAMDRTGDDR